MSAGAISQPFFALLGNTWKVAGLLDQIPGGFWNGGPPEQSTGQDSIKRPYLVVKTVAEAPQTFTTKSQYDRLDFEAALYGNEDYDQVAGNLIKAVETATLGIPPGTVLANGITINLVRPGPVRYEPNLPYWAVVEEFRVQAGKARGN